MLSKLNADQLYQVIAADDNYDNYDNYDDILMTIMTMCLTGDRCRGRAQGKPSSPTRGRCHLRESGGAAGGDDGQWT